MLRCLLMISLSVVLASALPAADWPQYLGPNRDGHSAETGLNWDWAKSSPAVAWKLDIGSGWAGPVIAGDRLILFHRVGGEEIVACLDPATSKEKWTFRYP